MSTDRRMVVFADLGIPWEAFTILAASLRRRGFDTYRLTKGASSRSQRLGRIALRAAYRRTESTLVLRPDGRTVDTSSSLRAVGDEVVDVQAVERARVALIETSWWEDFGWDRVPDPKAERRLHDKLHQAEDARVAGVTVSEFSENVDDIAGERIVLKQRVGSGGDAVEVVSRAEAAGVALSWQVPADELMYQEFIDGEEIGLGGFARHGQVQAGSAFRLHKAPGHPQGPAVRVTLLDRPELMDRASILLGHLRFTGAFCLDFLVGDDAYLIDLNPRFFGAWPALQRAGVPLLEAYLDHLDHASRPLPQRPVDYGDPLWSTLARSGDARQTLRTCLRTMGDLRALTGLRGPVALTPTLTRVLRGD